MSVVCIATTPGMTVEQYLQAMDRMGLRNRLPDNCTAHISGSAPDGWQVISVWDSAEALTRFQRDTLLPTFRAMGITPPTTAPVIYPLNTFTTDRVLTPA